MSLFHNIPVKCVYLRYYQDIVCVDVSSCVRARARVCVGGCRYTSGFVGEFCVSIKRLKNEIHLNDILKESGLTSQKTVLRQSCTYQMVLLLKVIKPIFIGFYKMRGIS
jgi:hypothetical protein